MKHTLVLHGALSKFGSVFELEAFTPHGMLSLLTRQIKELGEMVKKGKFRLIRGDYEYDNTIENGRYITLDLPLGQNKQELHLVPVLEGAGGDGAGKVIVGALIMVAAVVAAPFTGGTSVMAGLGSFTFGVGGATAFAIGGAIALSGVSQLIAPKPKTSSGMQESADERPSYFMSSPINMASENGAIPIIFGEAFAGSLIINARIDTVDLI